MPCGAQTNAEKKITAQPSATSSKMLTQKIIFRYNIGWIWISRAQKNKITKERSVYMNIYIEYDIAKV